MNEKHIISKRKCPCEETCCDNPQTEYDMDTDAPDYEEGTTNCVNCHSSCNCCS